jgi:hypothetical protein
MHLDVEDSDNHMTHSKIDIGMAARKCLQVSFTSISFEGCLMLMLYRS